MSTEHPAFQISAAQIIANRYYALLAVHGPAIALLLQCKEAHIGILLDQLAAQKNCEHSCINNKDHQ